MNTHEPTAEAPNAIPAWHRCHATTWEVFLYMGIGAMIGAGVTVGLIHFLAGIADGTLL